MVGVKPELKLVTATSNRFINSVAPDAVLGCVNWLTQN